MANKELQLEYLNNFIKRWELFNDKSDNKGMSLMTDELRCFCEANNLPFISADEIIAEINKGSLEPKVTYKAYIEINGGDTQTITESERLQDCLDIKLYNNEDVKIDAWVDGESVAEITEHTNRGELINLIKEATSLSGIEVHAAADKIMRDITQREFYLLEIVEYHGDKNVTVVHTANGYKDTDKKELIMLILRTWRGDGDEDKYFDHNEASLFEDDGMAWKLRSVKTIPEADYNTLVKYAI